MTILALLLLVGAAAPPVGASPPAALRLERLTRGFLGAKYRRSPLGERVPPDPDPRLRYDAFDCTTFVETGLALLHAPTPDDVVARLDWIRYDGGKTDYDHRRHLATSQWIPGLIRTGVLVDVTRALGGPATRVVRMRLTPRRWRRRRIARALILPRDRVPFGIHPLPYLPTSDVRRLKPNLPGGLVINLVRVNWPESPDLITHQGLLFRRGKRLFVRHASPVAKRVVDEPLGKVLRRYDKPREWPILGINFLRVREPVQRFGRTRVEGMP